MTRERFQQIIQIFLGHSPLTSSAGYSYANKLYAKRKTMKKLLLITIASLILSPSALAQPKPADGVEAAVLKLEQEWVDALVKADAAKLETLYADTLVYTHSSGSVDDKTKYIANLKAGGAKYQSWDRDSIKVNVYGDSAVVTCHVIIKLVTNGENRTIDARLIHVYAKVKGRWQMVAHQTTKLG